MFPRFSVTLLTKEDAIRSHDVNRDNEWKKIMRILIVRNRSKC